MEPTFKKDLSEQAVLIQHLLEEHPTLLRYSDLVRELTGGVSAVPYMDSETYMDQDGLNRAIRELRKHGLIDEGDGDGDAQIIAPTRPALYLGRTLPQL